jgi:hypothetical protein
MMQSCVIKISCHGAIPHSKRLDSSYTASVNLSIVLKSRLVIMGGVQCEILVMVSKLFCLSNLFGMKIKLNGSN